MQHRNWFVLALIGASFAAPALASDGGSTVSVAVSGGSLGVGPELGFRLSDHVGARANASFLDLGHGFDSSGIRYDGQAKLESYGAMLDVYPMGGHFRVSAGARLNDNRAALTATPSGPTRIGTTTYTPTQIGSLHSDVTSKHFAPALTLGWAGANRKGLFVGADAGVMFQGALRVGPFTSTGSLLPTAFQPDLARQRAELQDDVNDYKLYPVAQISAGYRF